MAALGAGTGRAAPVPCTPEFVAALKQPEAGGDSAVRLDCQLELQAGDVVARSLVIEGAAASGLRVRCHGALIRSEAALKVERDVIEVRSRRDRVKGAPTWSRPEDVEIDGCRVEGSIRVIGMGRNGQGEHLHQPSRSKDYVTQVRANAPRDIRFTRLRLTGAGRIPFYIAPGATRITLSDSEIGGRSRSVLVYLDAESADNLIERNRFQGETGREQIAVDASEDNVLRHNQFVGVRHGGIYLYRNCGEGGVIRHTTPSRNRITHNEFRYAEGADAPPVWLGSRNGWTWYCWFDRGHDLGSSADNRDFASRNEVVHNRVQGGRPGEVVKIGSEADAGNRVADNVWLP